MPPPPTTLGMAPARGWGRRRPGLLIPTAPTFSPKVGAKGASSCPQSVSLQSFHHGRQGNRSSRPLTALLNPGSGSPHLKKWLLRVPGVGGAGGAGAACPRASEGHSSVSLSPAIYHPLLSAHRLRWPSSRERGRGRRISRRTWCGGSRCWNTH